MVKNLFSVVVSFILFILACDTNPITETPDYFVWNTTPPDMQGMDPQVLDSAFTQAQQTGYIDGLLVIRNGFIVGEDYYNGYTKKSPHTIMSVSKSFLSALTGIALQRGYIDSLEEKVLDYFPEYIFPGMDERKYLITIRHLLTMRMGIPGESEDNYGVYNSIYSSDNWIKTTIEYPLVFTPGERMRYNTFQTHLISATLTKASEMSTLDLARILLTNPMNITIDGWEQDPQGYYFGGNSMFFTPREMAVLGYVYLNGGRLNNVQIVPQEWVELTLSPSTNNGPNEWGAWKNYNYAYLWWLGQMNSYDLFMAYGYGGQFIICFPDLDLIVVTTANNMVYPDASTIQEWAIFDIVADYVVPSIYN
ncbi:serine hydrolase domain-containing protein [bacterium]